MSDTPPTEGTPAPAEAAAAPLPSPGALLRQARERAGLGAEDLAGQLKLAKSTLEALERDDFAALSEPVYVRGYYRKIAKVLNVPESELIAAYNARSQPAPAAPAMRRIPLAGGVAAGTSRQHKGQGLWIAGGIGVVAVVLILLADHEPPQRLAPPLPATSGKVAPPAGPTTSLAALPVSPPGSAPSATPAGAPSGTPAATGDSSPAAVTTAAPAPPPALATTPAAAAAAAPAAPATAAVPNQLVLEFSEASFVRIEDNRQRTLAIGLVRGGERQVLDGQPPYTVFLGNAQNVKVFFGGVAVDFSAHVNRQNDTARFTVP